MDELGSEWILNRKGRPTDTTKQPMPMKTRNRLVLFLTVFISVLASLLATRAANIPAPDDQEEPAVVANGNGYFVVWADKRSYSATEYDIYGARVSNTGGVLNSGGIPMCTYPCRQTNLLLTLAGRQ